jgi:hypothetical protein
MTTHNTSNAPHVEQEYQIKTKTRRTDGLGLARPSRGLIVLNLALLGALSVVTFSPGAGAQMGSQVNRVRGEYSIVGGASIGGVSSTVYVLDSANRELIALNWNDSTKSLEGVGYRDLNRDSSSDPDR